MKKKKLYMILSSTLIQPWDISSSSWMEIYGVALPF
jgi:hypothetical protein